VAELAGTVLMTAAAALGAALGVRSTDDCNETTGLRIEEVVAYHAERHPWGAEPSQRQVAATIVDQMISLVKERASPMEGLESALNVRHTSPLQQHTASSFLMPAGFALSRRVLPSCGISTWWIHPCSCRA
jgi:hypothetical protein